MLIADPVCRYFYELTHPAGAKKLGTLLEPPDRLRFSKFDFYSLEVSKIDAPQTTQFNLAVALTVL
jgi:hypothetical protein